MTEAQRDEKLNNIEMTLTELRIQLLGNGNKRSSVIGRLDNVEEKIEGIEKALPNFLTKNDGRNVWITVKDVILISMSILIFLFGKGIL